MTNLKILFISFFLIFIILDYLNSINKLGWFKKYYLWYLDLKVLNRWLLIFAIVFILFTILDFVNMHIQFIDLNNYYNLVNENTNNNSDTHVHVHKGQFTINLQGPSTQSMNNLVAGTTAAGGAYIANKIAQNIPGGPGIKVGVGLGVAGVIYGGSALLGKSFNSQNPSPYVTGNSSITKNNFLPDNNLSWNFDFNDLFINLYGSPVLVEKYTDFPLNILSDIYYFTNIELFFIFILLNTFVVEYIMKLNYNKYIPDNKLGNLLKIFITRYIYLWNKSIIFIRIFSIIMIFICLFFIKYGFYFIVNY